MSLRNSSYVSTFTPDIEGGYPFQGALSKIVDITKSEAIEFMDGYYAFFGLGLHVMVRLENGQFAVIGMRNTWDFDDDTETGEFHIWPEFSTHASEIEALMVLEGGMEQEEEFLIYAHIEKGRQGVRDNVDFEKCYEDLHRIDINKKLRLGYSKEEAEAFVAMEEAAAELPSEDEKYGLGRWAN